MVGRPIFEEYGKDMEDLLVKAESLAKRLDDIEKAQPNYSVAFETTPHDISFESESGGRTRNAHYHTNNHLIESEDVANKGSSSSSVNLETLSTRLNTHDLNTGHLDDAGESGSDI